MLFTLDFQMTLMLFNVLNGLVLGLTYDLFKVLETKNGTNRFINILEWVLYYIFITISYYIAHVYFVKAFISWYTIVVCLISFIFYMKFLSRYIRKSLTLVAESIGSFFSIASKYIKLPFYAIKLVIKKFL